MIWVTERSAFQAWRQDLWSRIAPGRILEVGVGTGKNMPYYPAGARVTAIDLSDRLPAQAERQAQESGMEADLGPMDVQDLDFPDDTFEAAVATFVLPRPLRPGQVCSVPIVVRGLRELGRVVKPEGDIWLLVAYALGCHLTDQVLI